MGRLSNWVRKQAQVDVILGGIFSSTRQVIEGPAVVDGKTLYIYPSSTRGRSATR